MSGLQDSRDWLPMSVRMSCILGAMLKYSSRYGSVLFRMAYSQGVFCSLMYPGALGSISILQDGMGGNERETKREGETITERDRERGRHKERER